MGFNILNSKWVNDNFLVGDHLGSGAFGAVYTVECRKQPETLYAIKTVSPTSQPRYIASEIKILKQFGGKCNVMKIFASYRENDNFYIVMEHFPHDSLRDLLSFMSYKEKLEYMKNLFISLDYLHRNNVIHRDVKPANFLYNRHLKRYALIDFGLSHTYIPTPEAHMKFKCFAKENFDYLPSRSLRKRSAKCLTPSENTTDSTERVPVSNKGPAGRSCQCFANPTTCDTCRARILKNINKAGTPGFRAPEVLLRYDQCYQTPAIDIWAAGVTLLSLLLKRHPVFRPDDDFDAIAQICQLLGTVKLTEVARRRGVSLQIAPCFPGVDLAKLMRFARSGMDNFDSPADNCEACTRLIFDNTKGRCICKSGEAHSMDSLYGEDRFCLEILNMCLEPDPFNRFTAGALVDVIETAGY